MSDEGVIEGVVVVVQPCEPVLEDDLGSIAIRCDCRRRCRRRFAWHVTYPDLGNGTEAEVIAAFAAHRAGCAARDQAGTT